MKFLEYTKKLYEKVSYYDTVTKHKNIKFTNPFTKRDTITIIWVDNDKNI